MHTHTFNIPGIQTKKHQRSRNTYYVLQNQKTNQLMTLDELLPFFRKNGTPEMQNMYTNSIKMVNIFLSQSRAWTAVASGHEREMRKFYAQRRTLFATGAKFSIFLRESWGKKKNDAHLTIFFKHKKIFALPGLQFAPRPGILLGLRAWQVSCEDGIRIINIACHLNETNNNHAHYRKRGIKFLIISTRNNERAQATNYASD